VGLAPSSTARRSTATLSKWSFRNSIGDIQERTATNSDDDDAPSTTIPSETSTHLIFPGGGIFFYYQAGLVTFLRENGYDLSDCSFSGASAGALTATLTATEVDFETATDLALTMAADAGVWDRSSGLQGIWGPMIEDWLDTLLPPSIDDIQGKITLLVTPVPSFGKEKISNFVDRNDLIRCNMASVHLPWFLDGKLTSNFRDRPHIDGSFLSKAKDYIPHARTRKPSTIFLDWKQDPYMSSRRGLDFVQALTPDGIWGLLEQGKGYAKTMEEQGIFESLKKK